MRSFSIWPAVLGLALAMVLVILLVPVPHSLSYGGGVVVLLGLLGWVMEARSVAGPPPAMEPEHEEEEEAPGPSYWPLVLALGVVCIAAGLVYEWDYGILVVAIPLAGASGAGWLNSIKGEQSELAQRALAPVAVAEAPAFAGGGGGRLLMPVGPRVLAAQAAGGAAIAIERVPTREISRRGLLRITFWAGLGTALAAGVGVLFDLMWPRGAVRFGRLVEAGSVEEFAPGTPIHNLKDRFWLVNLTPEQGGPGFLALWHKCPHLGCTVPWRPEFRFVDPKTQQESAGWFRCPCHSSTYTVTGRKVFGPAPRSMDHFEVKIDPSTKRISVNTAKVTKGTLDNASFAVKG